MLPLVLHRIARSRLTVSTQEKHRHGTELPGRDAGGKFSADDHNIPGAALTRAYGGGSGCDRSVYLQSLLIPFDGSSQMANKFVKLPGKVYCSLTMLFDYILRKAAR